MFRIDGIFLALLNLQRENIQKDLLVQQPAGIILQNLWPNSLIPFHLKQPQSTFLSSSSATSSVSIASPDLEEVCLGKRC